MVKNEYYIGKKNKTTEIDIDLTGLKYEDMISRNHAKLFKNRNYWYVQDLNSKNGTFLIKANRRISLKDTQKLKVGDIIEIYKIKILMN